MPRRWFDAHLDLGYLGDAGRDMLAPLDRCGGPADPAVTLLSLREGHVHACLATVFTEPGGNDASSYPPGDFQAAHAAGLRQLALYQRWQSAGALHIGLTPTPTPSPTPTQSPAPLRAGILIENADPIRSPDELPWWAAQGVVAVGLTWARSSRYAGGNMTPLDGLTDLGRELALAIDAANLVHDLSHLSDAAMDQLLALTSGRVIASHSNCRALLDGKNNRHLRDDSIREIARRGGVIGLNLFRKFLESPATAASPDSPRPSLSAAADHIEHICQLAGHSRAVGLGSDMDGGFGASSLPLGIDRPADLSRLADELARRGWPDVDIDAFAWGNWARFWAIA